MANSYVRLWSSILDSSIWSASHTHRLVWITMLAMADEHGFVGASIDGLARRANVSEEDAEKAVADFQQPDTRSRDMLTDPDNKGRRIRAVERGWHIINHGYYRDLRDKEERREYDRRRQREHRERQRHKLSQDVGDKSATGHETSREIPPSSSSSSSSSPSVQSTEPAKPARAARCDPDFDQFWDYYGKKVDRPVAERAWRKIAPSPALAATIHAAAITYAKLTPDRQYRKNPATWLNARGWENEIVTPAGSAPAPARNMPNPARPAPVIHDPDDKECPCERCYIGRRGHNERIG